MGPLVPQEDELAAAAARERLRDHALASLPARGRLGVGRDDLGG